MYLNYNSLMNKSILVLQHVDCEGLGYFEGPLIKAGLNLKFIKLYEGETIPDVTNFNALIVLGGYMNVYEEDTYPFLKSEDVAIKKAISAGIPYLGICLGAQLLAKALDTKVYPNKAKEIGFYDIELTERGKADPLFECLPANLESFQWHGDTFDLPKGAELLASSKLCTHQAFRYQNAYSLQFHLETTPEMIFQWCEIYSDELKAFDSSLVINPNQALNTKPYAEKLIKNFINIIG